MLPTVNPEVLDNTQTCPAVGYQSASLCVPVTVTPFAQTGMTATKCCGHRRRHLRQLQRGLRQ